MSLNALTGDVARIVRDFIDLSDHVRIQVENRFGIDFRPKRTKVYDDTGPPSLVHAHIGPVGISPPPDGDWDTEQTDTYTVDMESFMFGVMTGSSNKQATFRCGHNYVDGRTLVFVSDSTVSCMMVALDCACPGRHERENLVNVLATKFHSDKEIQDLVVNQPMPLKHLKLHTHIFPMYGYQVDLVFLPLWFLRDMVQNMKGETALQLLHKAARELFPEEDHYF